MFDLIVIFVIVFSISLLYISTIKPKNYPPGPKWYPVKGSVEMLKKYIGRYGSQFKGFSELAKEYNTNVLGLKLGGDFVVVVFSYDIVKQVLKSHDFDPRPDNFFTRLRSMGTKKGITCADGELWSSQKQFLLRHLRNLGFGKQTMETMIQEELNDILLNIRTKSANVELGKVLPSAVISILWYLTAGVRIAKNDVRLEKILGLLDRRTALFDMSGGTLNMYPWLRFFAPDRCGYNLMVKVNEEIKSFFVDVIKEHYSNWTEGKDDDVIYSFISEMKKNVPNSYFTEDQLVMICADILIAGAQTTSHTLEFAFLMMILHKDVQQKVHKQLDEVYGRNGIIEFNSRASVPYIEAVIMEVERYCYVVPTSGPRRVIQDVTLDSYTIPKGTTILISIYSVNMDKTFWKDPEVFRPERFLDGQGRLLVPDRFLPFGSGKRRCLGEALAKSFIFTLFAGIMRNFAVCSSPDGPQPTDIPVPGITLKPQRYLATFTERS